MTLLVNGVEVPIVWYPASAPDYGSGRAGKKPIAIVHHRIVGGLTSADITFADNDHDVTTVGNTSRSVAAHFGIGHKNGRLEIHQYVDLSDTAYCNGDWDSTGNWDNWYGIGQVTLDGATMSDVNARTVSIEHDDQGGSADPTKKGIVTEDIIKASIALDRLMLSGDIAKMRAAGIRIRDTATAGALKAIPIDSKHLIDHHDIAGTNKPTCWKPWAADKVGFPRARYISELLKPVITPPPPPPPTDTTPFSQEDLDAAKQTSYLEGRRFQYDLDAANIKAELNTTRP